MFNSGCAKRFVFAVFAFVLSTLSREVYAWQAKGSGSHQFVIAIHGGGGVRAQEDMTSKSRMAHRKVLQMALEVGHEILFGGGTSVSAVEAAIRVMEDSPLFNAGKGASYNAAGEHELDASIMNGATLDAGAVAVVQRVRNPISLARDIMENTPHVMMAGNGALELAKQHGLEVVAPHYFFTQRKWDSLQRRLEQSTEYGKRPRIDREGGEAQEGKLQTDLAVSDVDPRLFGTVGAVAMDKEGNLAAGTSTGGREGKLPGRVGDSPVIGAGTYAKNSTLAVSSTGLGEYVIRVGGTKTMSDLIEYNGMSLDEATNTVKKMIQDMGGAIGVVAIDKQGNISMPFSGEGMYRGYVRQDGDYVVRIYRDE